MTDHINISWDIGTAYDFFTSLVILHRPNDFGVRAAWAAGMRQRLPTADRELLEAIEPVALDSPPLEFIYSLPEPKNSLTLFEVLDDMSPLDRLKAVSGHCDESLAEIYFDVAERNAYDNKDVKEVKDYMSEMWGKKPAARYIKDTLEVWTRGYEYGEGLIYALRAYYDVFFQEEERRIYPDLRTHLARAQKLAEHVSVNELVLDVSQGVHFSEFQDTDELVLVPSFWASPWIFYHPLSDRKMLMLFGARPADASLVPGEIVPDALLNALKALGDPTRLRIMRMLNSESLTPTQLAHRLRLRPPTVIHHLKALRTAGLVYVMVGDKGKSKEGGYQARTEGLLATCTALQNFILEEEIDHQPRLEPTSIIQRRTAFSEEISLKEKSPISNNYHYL